MLVGNAVLPLGGSYLLENEWSSGRIQLWAPWA